MCTTELTDFPEEKCVVFDEFKHFDEVMAHIHAIHKVTEDVSSEELAEQDLKRIFDFYQEQPHLLDPYLERLISECISIIRSSTDRPKAFHFAFRLLYLMVKTRGYKSVIRLMPHSVDDIEPTISLLVSQDIGDPETWKTRYVLLLWLSILTMIPFSLECLDSPNEIPIVERVLKQSKIYLSRDERTQEAASFLLARLVTRPDVIQVHLQPVVTWCIEQMHTADCSTVHGQAVTCGMLRVLANICKVGLRKELLPVANTILKAVISLPSNVDKGNLIHRLEAKLVQRVGLLFCPPRSTGWQYQRGCRSLADNLAPRLLQETPDNIEVTTSDNAQPTTMTTKLDPKPEQEEEEFELEYVDEVAEVIDRLIHLLRNQYTVVRWSAAKGLGRMCNRLGSSMVSDVLAALLALCTRLEPFTAWHGACLALAELGRRSLLLPSKLPEASQLVIPVVLRALFYDERSGDHNYGSNVRDAACYVCWAFARAYRAQDFSPYVNRVASALILVSLFDREVNVRRAAAAAFQENVGRQGQFPHGIDIITTCDYFALRNRTNCFLELSVFVAQFGDYTRPMIDHVTKELLSHWDGSIRFLAARTLNLLYPFEKEYMLQTILPELIAKSTDGPLYAKQGNIFGTAELIAAAKGTPLDESILLGIKAIVSTLSSHNQLRGLSGELLRKAVCHLIQQCSLANTPFHEDPVIEDWRVFLDDCLSHKEVEIRAAAASAYPSLLSTYLYASDGTLRTDYRDNIYAHLVHQLNANTETILSGYLQVLGQSPASLFEGNVARTIELLATASRITPKSRNWGEARQNSLKALVGICMELGSQHPELNAVVLQSIGNVLLRALSDYTVDSRGDIGSLVREVGMKCLEQYLGFLVTSGAAEIIQPSLVQDALCGIVQQAVEKIDRTRAVAGQAFAAILHHDPPIPHIPYSDQLKKLFPREECDSTMWRSAQQTFRKFVPLLDLPEFRFRLVLGLSVSVGGLTEDTVLCSSEALTSHLLLHESDKVFVEEFLCVVLQVFETFCHEERIIVPYFKFIDFLLNDPVISSITDRESPILVRLVDLIWEETKSSKEVLRIKSAIDVLGGMLQFEGTVRTRASKLLLVLLGHRYPVIRKSAATKLYECLIVYELVDPEATDEVVVLLTETIWESNLDTIRPIRNKVSELLGLPAPVPMDRKLTADPSVLANGEAGDTRG
ncbi:tubulin-specific chaperone D [Clonorchis sinensis]|uniref:Tubulin-specific chaperone D n=1 Tax=Clonorchis sinensis TaxID=79923 RepID=H2KQ95_CLOSI|nr:tubulin-specific chaperone D [Clonorchis sinensis]